MGYRFSPKPTFYNGVLYRSRLEAKWAVFFDLINWKYVYEPFDLHKWSPDFLLITESGQRFTVEVKPNDCTDLPVRLKIGEASNYSDTILLLNESPFMHPYPNCIGLSSLDGKIKNPDNKDDFEFSTSVVMNLYNQGTGIFNLCMASDDVLDNYDTAKEFCLPLWKEAGDKVMFLKPKQ